LRVLEVLLEAPASKLDVLRGDEALEPLDGLGGHHRGEELVQRGLWVTLMPL